MKKIRIWSISLLGEMNSCLVMWNICSSQCLWVAIRNYFEAACYCKLGYIPSNTTHNTTHTAHNTQHNTHNTTCTTQHAQHNMHNTTRTTQHNTTHTHPHTHTIYTHTHHTYIQYNTHTHTHTPFSNTSKYVQLVFTQSQLVERQSGPRIAQVDYVLHRPSLHPPQYPCTNLFFENPALRNQWWFGQKQPLKRRCLNPN